MAKFAPSYFTLSSKENDMSLDSSLDSLSSMDWTDKNSVNIDPEYQSSNSNMKLLVQFCPKLIKKIHISTYGMTMSQDRIFCRTMM